MYSHLLSDKYGGQRYIEDPSLYAIPAPRVLGTGLLCLCKKLTWVTGSLVHMMFTPINKVAAGSLLSDPTVVNVLCSSAAGANLLRVTDTGNITGVQQTIGFLLHKTVMHGTYGTHKNVLRSVDFIPESVEEALTKKKEVFYKEVDASYTDSKRDSTVRFEGCIHESVEKPLSKTQTYNNNGTYYNVTCSNSCNLESVAEEFSTTHEFKSNRSTARNIECTYGINDNATSYDNCKLQALGKRHGCNDKNIIGPDISFTHRTDYNAAGSDCCIQESVAEVLKKTRGFYNKETIAPCIDNTYRTNAKVASSDSLKLESVAEALGKRHKMDDKEFFDSAINGKYEPDDNDGRSHGCIQDSDDTELIIREINGTYVADYIVSSSGAGKNKSAAGKQESGNTNKEPNASTINTPHGAGVNARSSDVCIKEATNVASYQSYPNISSTPVTASMPYQGLPKIDRVFSLAADTSLKHSTQSKQCAHIHRPESNANDVAVVQRNYVKHADISCCKEQPPVQKSTMARDITGGKNISSLNGRLKLKLRWNKRWEIEKPGCTVSTSNVNDTSKTTQLISVAMRRQVTQPYTITSKRKQAEDIVLLSGVSGEDIGILKPKLSTFGSKRIVTMKNKVPWVRIHKLGTDGTGRIPFKQLHSI